ncbi:MAG: triose-phosphate isomerase, partial [Candidatus Altiarchaeota archaeon]|nr:triose-phosphate isomerase [Candidatus Altiarchaeota archaeon]
MEPSYIVNFKAYENGTGAKALELARKLEEFAEQTKVDIGVAVQPTDIEMIASNVELPVFAQHIDPVNFGSHTGHVLPESVVSAGAIGTLLNHSEDRLDFEVLKASIQRAREVGLQIIV